MKFNPGDSIILVSGTEIRYSLVCEVDGDPHKGELYKIDNDTPTKKFTWYTKECLFPNTTANSEIATQLINLAYAKDLIEKTISNLKKGLTQNE